MTDMIGIMYAHSLRAIIRGSVAINGSDFELGFFFMTISLEYQCLTTEKGERTGYGRDLNKSCANRSIYASLDVN